MIKLVILFIFLLILLILSIVLSSGSVLNPQFLFVSGFALSVGYAFFYVKEMELELADTTFMVLFFGIFIFFIVSMVGQKIGRIRDIKYVEKKQNNDYWEVGRDVKINVDFWKLLLFLLINLLSVALFLRFIMAFSNTGSIKEAVFYYDHIGKFTSVEVDLPGVISILRMTSSAIIYICIYLLAHQVVYGYKQNRLLIYANIILSCINSILSGGRAVSMGYIFAFVLMAYYIYKTKYDWKRKIPTKVLFFLFCAVLLIIPVFYISAFLMGRGKQTDIFHYMCIYLSGEIKNLDVFIRKGVFGADISNSQTLVSLRRTVLPSFGITGWTSKLDLPFINVHGFSTGNVYTIFYMFMYDGGFAALLFYTVVMALIMNLSYRYVVNVRFRKYYNTVNLPLIIYSQLAYAILFSFFSDKFYELVLDLAFWRKTIIMVVLVWFVTRFKITCSDETAIDIKRKEFIMVKNVYAIRNRN